MAAGNFGKKLVWKGDAVSSKPALYAKTHDFNEARKTGVWLFLKIVLF